jgi:hypothetical protein
VCPGSADLRCAALIPWTSLSDTRANALRDHAAGYVDEVRSIAPTGIIVCDKPSFLAVSDPLRVR